MRFKAMLHGREIEGDCVNPGQWFGKWWIIESGCGFSSIFFAVEADDPSSAIDELVDHEEFGKCIRMDEDYHKEQLEEAPDDIHYAGNECVPIDMENVYIHKDGVADIKYITGDMTPEEYASR